MHPPADLPEPDSIQIRGVALAVCLSGVACGPERLQVAADGLPESSLVAAIFETPRGELLASTGLHPLGEELEVPGLELEGPVRVTAAAFSPEDLPSDLNLLREAPVAPATPSDPVIPRPTWVGRGTLESSSTLVLAPDPNTDSVQWSASWVEPCGKLGEVLLNTNCSDAPCFPPLRQTGCAVDIDLQGCELGEVQGRVEPNGLVEASELRTCAIGTDREPAVWSFACAVEVRECVLDVFRVGDLSESNREEYRPSGRVRETVAMGDVLYLHEAEAEGCRWKELKGSPIEVVATGTVAECPQRLFANSRGGTFEAVGMVVESRDDRHRLRAAVDLSDPRISADALAWEILDGGDKLFVTFYSSTQAPLWLVELDPETLEKRSYFQLSEVDGWSAITWQDGSFLVAEDRRDALEVWSYPQLERIKSSPLERGLNLSVAWDQESGAALVGVFARSGRLLRIDAAGEIEPYFAPKTDLRIARIVPWPEMQEWLLVGYASGAVQASAFRFDLKRRRLLPVEYGPVDIGETFAMGTAVQGRSFWLTTPSSLHRFDFD